VKVVGVLYIALSALNLIAASFLMLALGIAGGIVGSSANSHDAAIALPIIGLAGSALVVFLVVLALPGLIAGIGLLRLRPWARVLAIVLSIVHLVHIPLGTILGIYGLWVFFNPQTEALFRNADARAA